MFKFSFKRKNPFTRAFSLLLAGGIPIALIALACSGGGADSGSGDVTFQPVITGVWTVDIEKSEYVECWYGEDVEAQYSDGSDGGNEWWGASGAKIHQSSDATDDGKLVFWGPASMLTDCNVYANEADYKRNRRANSDN